MDRKTGPSPLDIAAKKPHTDELESSVESLLNRAEAEPEKEVAMLQQAHALLHQALQ
ncbi:hypothetical protein [Corynebacterium gerontici]|uniref:Uncharacterized protein n=1 Tax=Corynebacterium gerontici TaxID=2079234 RepID=A0A3G6J0N2_9CORY|nr:hypothetical protein [Corynebacterium gerontici]AZA11353.1 hypothetical protein CGERO_05220 [Corynebacterium gerontici]